MLSAAGGGDADLREAVRRLDGCAEAALEAQLPAGGEHHYYSNFASYSGPLGESLATILKLLTTCESVVRPRRAAAPDWTDADEVAEWVSSLLDDALEGVDTAIDEANARATRKGAGAAAMAVAAAGGGGAAAGADDTCLVANLPSFGGASVRPGRHKGPARHAAQLARPQDQFQPPVDNSSTSPFRPQVAHLQGLTAVPLDSRAYTAQPGADASYPHPFQHELDTLSYEGWQLAAGPAQAPATLEDTPLAVVDTADALATMVAELSGCSHIAIDLEAHSYRSFQGFTCLLQLSSRTKDYIVDALALRNQLGPALARLFADPKVVKVLHGADSDIDWLQRDFGLYLVNMFDTGQAMRVLCYPAASLAYLLEHTAGFQADKRYQLADWRVRPLPADMLHYARCDTHYLLHAHDRLKQQLAELPEDKVPPSLALPLPSCSGASGALGLVLERSRQLCLKLYRKDAWSPDAFKAVVARWGLRLSPQQAGVFAALWEWRDRVCRAEDESTGYVLPKVQLVALAQDMPDSAKRLQAVLGRGISEVVLRRISEVLAAINMGKHRPVDPQDMVPPAGEATNGPAAAAPGAAASLGSASAAAPNAGAGVSPAVSEAAGPSAGGAGLKPRAVAPIRSRGAAAGPSSMMMMGGGRSKATPPTAGTATDASAVAASQAMPPPPHPGAGPGGLQARLGAAQDAPSSAPAGQQQVEAGSSFQAARAASLGLSQVHSLDTWLRGNEASGAAVCAAGGAPPAAASGPANHPGAAAGEAGPSAAPAEDESAGALSPAAGKRTAAAAGGGGSVMAALIGGGGASKRSRLGAGALGSMMGTTPQGSGRSKSDRAAAEQVSQLRASFALPFVSAPQGGAAVNAAAIAAAPKGTGGEAAAAAADAAPSPNDNNNNSNNNGDGRAAGLPRSSGTAAGDVRAVAEQLRASGKREVHIGADGAELAPPSSSAAAAQQDSEAGAGTAEDEAIEADAAAPAQHVPGQEFGLDGLDFVPVPLSQISKKDKKTTRRQGGGGGTLRDGRGGAKHATLMRKYVTELSAPGGNGGEDDDYSANSDASGSGSDGPAHGPFAKKRRGAAPATAQAAASRQQPAAAAGDQHADRTAAVTVTPFDYGKAKEQQRRMELKRSGEPASGIDAFGGRGGGRGRGRGRGAARGGGRAAFNPFDIADEDLIKGGKRSVTMPRSGNRTFTFK